MDLDFSALSDDQLIGLIRSACAEAITRGSACEAAARDAYMSAAERVQVAQAAAAAEADRVRREEAAEVARAAADRVRAEAVAAQIETAETKTRRLWAQKKGIALVVRSLFQRVGFRGAGGITVNVWLSGSKEQRVYIGKAFDTNYITFYATGGDKHRPGKLVLADSDFKPMKDEIVSFCAALVATWTTIKFSVSEALAWEGDPLPLEGYVGPPPVAPPEASAPAPVTLPATLAPREGALGVRCLDCASWVLEGEQLVHAPACSTKAAIPDGYVWPTGAAS